MLASASSVLMCIIALTLFSSLLWTLFLYLQRAAHSRQSSHTRRTLKGPQGFPVIGSLHLLGGPEGPFHAFTNMAKTYGDIFAIQLGVSKCVVVSSYKLIKEVLITKGNYFGGRPNFQRFHQLFGGDRNNSLALCDWSDLQRKRRAIARSFCSPRGGSFQQEELSRVAVHEADLFINHLRKEECASILNGEKSLKPLVLVSLGNMFTQYMCSTRFGYTDTGFNSVVRTFDEIFWDINQGFAVDFLPWLGPFYYFHMRRISGWATEVRRFILKRIIEHRRPGLDKENGARDFTDALLLHLESPESELSWQHIIFELEDFLGGHSAVGNLVMLILANIVISPDVQTKIHEECDRILDEKKMKHQDLKISLDDKTNMPYTDAVIWETLRMSSSPIVPHVASQNAEIDGYKIEKDTVVFINNFGLNLEEAYWGSDSREFKPERFLKEIDNEFGEKVLQISKPAHFVPFSTGKRTCIGQRLVQGCSFVLLAALLSQFTISSTQPETIKRVLRPGCVAIPPDSFHLLLTPRTPATTTDEQ